MPISLNDRKATIETVYPDPFESLFTEIKRNKKKTLQKQFVNAIQMRNRNMLTQLNYLKDAKTSPRQRRAKSMICIVLYCRCQKPYIASEARGPGPGVCSLSIKCVPPLSPPSLGPNLEKYRRRAKSRNL